MKSKTVLVTLVMFGIAALLSAGAHYSIIMVPAAVLVASRWLAFAGLTAYAWQRRSLTTWILISMVVGAELGHDLPGVAVSTLRGPGSPRP